MVHRDDVHRAMQLLDASGLMRRKPGKCRIDRIQYSSRGPNDTWHIDGNIHKIVHITIFYDIVNI